MVFSFQNVNNIKMENIEQKPRVLQFPQQPLPEQHQQFGRSPTNGRGGGRGGRGRGRGGAPSPAKRKLGMPSSLASPNKGMKTEQVRYKYSIFNAQLIRLNFIMI